MGTGPLFDGGAARLVDGMCADIEREIGQEGEALVLAHLAGVLKNPTGFYASKVTSHPSDHGDVDVVDGGVVYGPWLEGVGSRNRTTRFKGYATFRRVAQTLQRKADGIAERVARPWIGRMG